MWWWYVECITHCHCISHLITSLPPHQTPLFQTTYSTSHHHSSFYHSAPLAAHWLCNTVFQIAPYLPHYASHHWHFTLLTYHVTPHSMYSTQHQFQITPFIGHIIYASHHKPHYTTLHHIPHAPHLASFHHSWLITQFHIARPNTTTFYIPPLNTFRITPPPLTRIAHTLPHFTSRKVRSMPQHTYQSILHHHFPVWETRNYTWSQVMLVCRGAGWKHERRVTSWSCYNFYLHKLGNRVGSPLNQMHRQQLELRRPATAETLGGKRTRRWWSDD